MQITEMHVKPHAGPSQDAHLRRPTVPHSWQHH
jgi:hypothetical protein